MIKNLELLRLMVPANRYATLCNHEMEPVGIVVHNTANTASAKAEVVNMINNNNWRSFHFAVDNVRAVQAIETNRNAWSAGDGVNGAGNRKYIAVEICYSMDYKSNFYPQSQDKAAYLIAELLKSRGWGIERVKRHYDFSGKDCPHRMLLWQTINGKYQMNNQTKWLSFLSNIQTYLNELNAIEAKAKAEAEAATTTTTTQYVWKVQCGAFKTQEQAQSYAKTLNSKGIATYVYEEK